MGTTLITRRESTFFLISFLVLFALNSSSVVLLVFISLFSLFLLKRREVYFIFSIIAPRITGDAPILKYLIALAREEGPGNDELPDAMQIRVPFLPPMFFFFKADYIKRILSLQPDDFPSGGDQGPMVPITGFSGKNILLSSGPPNPHWAKYREVTSYINKDRFGETSMLATMFDIAFRTTQELAVTHFTPKLNTSLDLFKELYHVMIPAHNRALFGEEFARKFTYSDLSIDVYDIITETGKRLKFNIALPHLQGPYMAKIRRVTDAIRNMCKNSTSQYMTPLLEAAQKGKLTEEELMSNVMVFEFAQAPLHVAFWVLYALALHPEEEKKVVAEIANVLNKGPMTYSRLSEFKYLTQCVSETLRLYPGVGLMQIRTAARGSQFGSHFVPEGAFVFLCQYLIHRNATHWPNPDEFIPDREGIDPSLYGENLAYIPFGNGPRQCQGQYFALDFIKLSVINMLRNYKIRLAPGQKEAQPTEIGFLRPSYPVFVLLEKRVLPTETVQPSPAVPIVQPHQQNSSSAARSEGGERRREGEEKRKGVTPRFAKLSKTANLVNQSQIFKDSFINIGKLKNTQDLLIFYGSQSGTARSLALRVLNMANLCKLSATVAVLNDFDASVVKQYKAVVIVTATYSDGSAPENAELFEHWLGKQDSTDLLSGVPYSVLSLGSSMYPFPFRFGALVNRRLAQLGAVQLMAEERIDEIKYNTQQVFESWSARLFDAISAEDSVGNHSKDLVSKNKLLGFQNFDFNVMQVPFKLTFTNKPIKNESRSTYPKNMIVAKVISNQIVNADETNEIYSIELSLPADSLTFEAGDNAIVLPSNPMEDVKALIERLGFEKDTVFHIEGQELNQIDLSCSLGRNKCSLEIALTHYLDITSTPSSSMLKFLAMKSSNEQDQKTILSYNSNYLLFLSLNFSILDLIQATPSIQLGGNVDDLATFLGLLGPIKQRHYSIANSPHSGTNVLRILYKVVSYTSKIGRNKYGLCSNYLKAKKEGDDMALGVIPTKFRLPSDNSASVVMVGAGSGISPYFGFLEQRHYIKRSGKRLGKAVLVHGCRTKEDFACEPQVKSALEANLLSELWPAYSRREGFPKVHVQDALMERGEEMWRLLSEGATIYVCGDVSVGMSVRNTLVDIAKIHGKFGAYKAHSWLAALMQGGRLKHDEWGIATSSGLHAIRAARLRLWRKSIRTIFAFSKKHI